MIADCGFPTNGWCRVVTTSSGKFQIGFSLTNAALNNNDEFPLELRFAKSTGSITHRFLCNEGTRDCSARHVNNTVFGNATSSTFVNLQHLKFDSPIQVVDDTVIPFRGKVTVAGTESTRLGVPDLGCPVVGVKVCLKDFLVRSQFTAPRSICVETNSLGEYEPSAVVGTVVAPFVDYRNHTFQPASANLTAVLQTGIEIKPDVKYEGFNLKDVTNANLTLEVAGGLCDRVLGRSIVNLTKQGCRTWPGVLIVQGLFRQDHQVISQALDLKIVSVSSLLLTNKSSRLDIVNALRDTKSIDLRDTDGSNKAVKTPDGFDSNKQQRESSILGNTTEVTALKQKQNEIDADLKNPVRVRFQFNGTDVI